MVSEAHTIITSAIVSSPSLSPSTGSEEEGGGMFSNKQSTYWKLNPQALNKTFIVTELPNVFNWRMGVAYFMTKDVKC